MTVQEFIDKLSQYDPNTAVTMEFRDHTDYLYIIDMGEIEVVEQNEAIIGGRGGYIDDEGEWVEDDLIEGKAITFMVNDCEKAFYGI